MAFRGIIGNRDLVGDAWRVAMQWGVRLLCLSRYVFALFLGFYKFQFPCF